MTLDGLPPRDVDALFVIRCMTANTVRKVERAARDGRLVRQWAERIQQALGRVLSECDRARAAGALLPADPEVRGESVEVQGLEMTARLPTEAARAAEAEALGL